MFMTAAEFGSGCIFLKTLEKEPLMAKQERAMRYTKPSSGSFCGEWRQIRAFGAWYFFADDEVALIERKNLTVTEFLRDEHLECA